VDPAELVFGAVLVVLLVGLAGYFTWQQRATLRELHAHPEMPPEDRRYLRRQVMRRLFCSALMGLLAGMLVAWYFYDESFRELFREGREKWAAAEQEVLTERQKEFSKWMGAYWSAVLGVLFLIVAVAAADALAIGRYGLRQRRRLRDERQQTLLELEAARRRHRGNGRH
jgi:hypothetical protein